MCFPEVPTIEPCWWYAVDLLDLHSFPRVFQAELSFSERRVHPCEIAIKHVVELPTVFRLEGYQGLKLLQREERIGMPALLHPHGAQLIQAFQKPGSSAQSAKWDDPVQNPICFINVIILQVDSDQIERHTKIPWFKKRCRKVCLWQTPCKSDSFWTIGKCHLKKAVCRIPDGQLRHNCRAC